MKIALCFHGYFANSGGVSASIEANKYIKDKILNHNNVDIFVHSWDLDNEWLVTSMYECKSTKFEKQIDFKQNLKNYKQDWFFGDSSTPPGMYSSNTIDRALSIAYSRKEVMNLKSQHEQEAGFTYDCVIISRFDLGTRGKEYPQEFYATDIHFDPSIDMNFLYSLYWNQLNWGFADHWFYSSSKNMDILAGLYDKIEEYYQPDSPYTNAVTTGWPDSNSEDEFSNEFYKEEKSSNLVSFPRWGCIDNHKLYKWYFIDTGLYEKCKFIDTNSCEVK